MLLNGAAMAIRQHTVYYFPKVVKLGGALERRSSMARRGLLILINLSVLSLSARVTSAQDQAGDGPARIEVGSRVRVTAPAIYEGRLVGHVIAFIFKTFGHHDTALGRR